MGKRYGGRGKRTEDEKREGKRCGEMERERWVREIREREREEERDRGMEMEV